MAVFRCQSCGAGLEVPEGSRIAFCPYCGMKQTLPDYDSVPSVDSLMKRGYMFLLNQNLKHRQLISGIPAKYPDGFNSSLYYLE